MISRSTFQVVIFICRPNSKEPSDNISQEYKVTALTTLGEIACVSATNEKSIIFEFCNHAIEQGLSGTS